MIEHIVLFNIRRSATEEQKGQMLLNLLGLREKISGIHSATAGENFSARAKGFTHGFVVRFISRSALEAYLPHPAHQEVVEKYIKPIAEEILVVDYETD
ncbi:MAG TPA: Dabb family protein [Elusimicrobiota bacterium]|nr:Dabb family protein [Elusimicrobiota bacterium]